ncbi:MAG: hypothetical protein P8Y98_07900 [Anaerolineales bacterium]
MESRDEYEGLYKPDPSRQDAYRFRRLRYGLFFGIIGALAYSCAAWGVDGFDLSKSHAIYPWLKLGLGTWICVIIGGAASLFTVIKDRGQVSVVVWLFTGVAFGLLVGHIPFEGATMLLNRFDPDLSRLIAYPFHEGARTRTIFAIVGSAGIFLIAGPFLPSLVDISSKAGKFFERWMPIVVWAGLFVLAGSLADSVVNQPLRSPVIVMDELVQFKLDHEGIPIEHEEALEMHVSALGSITDLIQRPRRLILGGYDVTLVSIDVLIDFDGVWVKCAVLDDQPGYCRRIE